MSILVVNQSVIDTFASAFTMITMTLVMDMKTTGLSRDSVYDHDDYDDVSDGYEDNWSVPCQRL